MLRSKPNGSFFVIILVLFLTSSFVKIGYGEYDRRPYLKKHCDAQGVLIYEDMNCILENRKRNGCPSEYTCHNLEKINNTCYYKGDTYQTGQMVNQSAAFCRVGCICENGENGMSYSCAEIDCFDLPVTPPCYRTYNLERCCPNGLSCPIDPPYQCVYDGETYKEGQRFFPRDSCSMCVCKRGFRGKIEAPYCTRRKCDVELTALEHIQNVCAPQYSYEEDLNNGILCCPSDWICADGNEVIIGKPLAEPKCRFGNTTLRVGQEIRKYIPGDLTALHVTCKCYVPPLLTCVQNTVSRK